ncbi:nitrate/nitrite two-component system sensor histidine kinase NarQ [Enterovibrio sp. ZSDZ42]|uniref:Sensor protein n=1 Tax=Enterovibrio gelatinilyticus TaxID=2899819 RepID=A0ABT5QYT0_9GAMM|nr:nitrate/nitrite two-component system sensor histidine kinase NarQ [Enterovibrio sp. ZSDZ42]MDD1793080.1 nitrate/nitrite two-component system sensor histidine kinase NarQ [Enterovibrio sp. ZSDZ42]
MTNSNKEIEVKQSVTTTVARALLVILLLAVLITGFSIITLASSLNDASAINTAGSLRMQSYRVAYDIVVDSPLLPEHVQSFEYSLLSPELLLLDNPAVPTSIRQQYDELITRWMQLRPELLGSDRAFYLEQVGLFVNNIDRFVFELQKHSEDKLQALAISGSIGLGLILATVLFLIQYTQRRIVQPLNTLVRASQQIQRRDFDVVLPPTRSNELGVLSNSFSSMASELKNLYADLESKIESKTQKLTKANLSLNVLYKCSTLLSSSQLTRTIFENILETSLNAGGMTALKLDVHHPNESHWGVSVGDAKETAWHTLPLLHDNEVLGSLDWQGDNTLVDSALLESIAAILARGVRYKHAQKQAMHLAVMEERATLARELHDSIAQSLSYLKIQTSILKRHLKNANAPDCEPIADDISEQLRVTYDQLRELLTAFRLSLSNSDFRLALEEMISTLQGQTTASINVSSSIDTVSMTVEYQMHVLQIIREACVNAIKHANATTITVQCRQMGQRVYVEISDNGIGFDLQEEKPNHYGLQIMQERSKMLCGDIEFLSAPAQGCRVLLSFNQI